MTKNTAKPAAHAAKPVNDLFVYFIGTTAEGKIVENNMILRGVGAMCDPQAFANAQGVLCELAGCVSTRIMWWQRLEDTPPGRAAELERQRKAFEKAQAAAAKKAKAKK